MISADTWRRVLENEMRIRSYFSRRSVDSGDVEDLVQESIARAAECFSRYRGEAPLLSWIYGICRNTIHEYYRSGSRKRELFRRIVSAESRDTDTDRVERIAVEMAVERLDPPMRRLYDLHYRREMVIEEIAEVLSIPTGTVKYRLYRLRFLLRRLLSRPASGE